MNLKSLAMISPFFFSSLPKIHFGAGKISIIQNELKSLGKNILIITGGSSLRKSGVLDSFTNNLKKNQFNIYIESISSEPSPKMIDDITDLYKSKSIDVVIGIGGGSVLDAGKAISAMIPVNDSVYNYLEGVGSIFPSGEKITYIAIPTTAGTGSEATKNAVISEIGENGFKKSLRHDNYIPNIAIIDPELTLNCSPELTAAGGMDAFTQLVESYLSTQCDEITASLALPAMAAIKRSLLKAYKNGNDISARTDLSYAALISGITLANAGLGTIHGFASPIGALFSIPHGVVCGTLMAASNSRTLKKLIEENNTNSIKRYEDVAKIFVDIDIPYNKLALSFIEVLYNYTSVLNISKLSNFGINLSDIDNIVSKTVNKNNPAKLNNNDLKDILLERL